MMMTVKIDLMTSFLTTVRSFDVRLEVKTKPLIIFAVLRRSV